MEYITEYSSPIGKMLLSGEEDSLTGLWLENQKYFSSTLSNEYEERMLPVFERAIEWIDCYFNGGRPNADFPLKPKGSEFRQAVWKKLMEIPYGETTTYGRISKELEAQTGKRVSAQAVGGAIAHNPILIVVPCHRVIGSDGSLTGYAGGIDKKQYLLELEKRS